jgi:hypothetical protein
LSWRLSTQGAAIHFRSNGFSFRQPEDGDIYAILRYLALVYPQSSSATEVPLDDTSYRILFTPRALRFTESGWTDARVLTPEALPLPGARRRPPA